MHDDIPFPRVKCFSTHRERARPFYFTELLLLHNKGITVFNV